MASAAWLHGAKRVIGVDTKDYRLDKAYKTAGAETIDASKVDPVEAIREMTGGRGADVCVDAVGMDPDKTLWDRVKSVVHMEKGSMKVLQDCFDAVRRGGIVTVMGVYGSTYDNFPLHQFFDKGLLVRGGQAPVHKYIDKLITMVQEGKVVLDDIITHRLSLEDAPHGYKIFNDRTDDCVKVVLKPGMASTIANQTK